MTDPIWVNSRIQFDIAAAIKAADGKLHIDEALIIAGTPCVLVDYAKVSDRSLQYIQRAMRQFFKRNPRYTRFTKQAVEQGLRQEWLPNLEDEEKRLMLADFRMTPGVDADGYIIFDPVFVENLTKTEHPDHERYGKDDYTRVNQNGKTKLLRHSEAAIIYFHEQDEEGYISAPLDITADEWYQIIVDVSPLIKEYLACYIQMPDGKASCMDIEKTFGISADSINSRNTALGRRAQRMLDIEVYDESNPTKTENRRFWSTPMLKGRTEQTADGKFFVWQMRPELIEATKRLVKDEHLELPIRKEIY